MTSLSPSAPVSQVLPGGYGVDTTPIQPDRRTLKRNHYDLSVGACIGLEKGLERLARAWKGLAPKRQQNKRRQRDTPVPCRRALPGQGCSATAQGGTDPGGAGAFASSEHCALLASVGAQGGRQDGRQGVQAAQLGPGGAGAAEARTKATTAKATTA
jgi:hypothetical protein